MKSFIEWFLKWRRASEKPPENTAIVDLNFKVTDLFRRKYKIIAAHTGMTMKEVLEDSCEVWLQKNGDDKLRAMIKTITDGK
jgi:hypothetical protein